jgi:drug/metabolite transporter (DMT)-like permease
LVSVVAALYPAWTVLLARVVLGERTGRTQQAGLVLAAVAVGLIAGAA